jgi:hypothetical protein
MPRRAWIFYPFFKEETLAPPPQKNQILLRPSTTGDNLQKNSLLKR